jgi:hypothetical protein
VSVIFAAFFAIRGLPFSREAFLQYYPRRVFTMHVVKTLKRIGLAFAATAAALTYVWVAAVRAAPGVRRRKAEARARRRG